MGSRTCIFRASWVILLEQPGLKHIAVDSTHTLLSQIPSVKRDTISLPFFLELSLVGLLPYYSSETTRCMLMAQQCLTPFKCLHSCKKTFWFPLLLLSLCSFFQFLNIGVSQDSVPGSFLFFTLIVDFN